MAFKLEEVKLIYRNKTKAQDRPIITCAKDAFNVFAANWDRDQINLIEESKVLLLDRGLKVMSIAQISQGGMSATIVDPKVIFALAVKRRASRFILAHNHPSGNLKPSHADIKLTKHLKELGVMMQLPLDDHLIISDDDYFSMLENDLM